MVFVACCAASRSHRDPPIAMTSTPRVTSSAKIAGARYGCPSADRLSMTIVPPQPNRGRANHAQRRAQAEKQVWSCHLGRGDDGMDERDDRAPRRRLSACDERPSRRAAEKRDDLAAFHCLR
jgi:hypothetical protein